MADIDYRLDGEIAVMTLNCGENRFNDSFLESFLSVMDDIEENTDARTLIVTSSDEKIFANGIDLEWFMGLVKDGDTEALKAFLYKMNTMFKRIVTSPMIIIGAISGHAFAGGAILACAFDFRLMRSDRGYFCFPEVDLGIPFLPGMLEIIKSAVPLYKMDEMQYMGLRLTAEECEAHHIITKACHLDDLMDESLNFARRFNKERKTVKEMKTRMNKKIIHALEVEDVEYIKKGRLV